MWARTMLCGVSGVHLLENVHHYCVCITEQGNSGNDKMLTLKNRSVWSVWWFLHYDELARCCIHTVALVDCWPEATDSLSVSHASLSFNPTSSHSHSLLPWLITSFALSFLNIMWGWVKCYGKLSKIKMREQLYSPVSRVTFIAQPVTEARLRCPWSGCWWQTADHERSGSVASRRGGGACTTHYHSPSMVCFVLIPFSHFVCYFSPSPVSISFLWLCVPLPPPFPEPLSFQVYVSLQSSV